MIESGSILQSFVEKVRSYSNEPSQDARFNDSTLVRMFFSPSLAEIMARLAMSAENLIINKYAVSIVDNQEFYQLPPSIKSVIRLVLMDEDGRILNDYKPESEFSMWGPGWTIEGNMLAVRPLPSGAADLHLWYVPSMDVSYHWSALGGRTASDTTNKTFSLATSPTLGSLDKRANAYGGSILRVIESNTVKEYVIETHTPSATPTVTLRTALSGSLATSGVTYEIAPYATETMLETAAWRAALKLATIKRASASQLRAIGVEYNGALKTLQDTYGNIQGRVPRSVATDTIDTQTDGWVTTV